MLFYTYGAIERRGEPLRRRLQRLKDVSMAAEGSLDEFLDRVVTGVLGNGSADDTALLGVRWQT